MALLLITVPPLITPPVVAGVLPGLSIIIAGR
jgi:hypothetical protein